jgi:S1-C subfamily serine protease
MGTMFNRGRPAGCAFNFVKLLFLSAIFVFTTCCLSCLAAAEPDIRRDATVVAVEQVMPSVVNIATETIIRVRDPFEDIFRQFWDPYHRRQPPNSQYSLGSGVVIDEAGYVLTNDHVVRRADKIAVKFASGTNAYDATIVASDPKSDVALLKLKARPGEKFHAIKLAREDDLLLGETVLAMGNPFGLGGSVTHGILSSKSRTAPKEGESLDIPNWLQIDAPINFGNSGGPLVNLRGELIGINVAILGGMDGQPAQGIGFAIPIRRVAEALSEIFPTESVKSFWFGARVKVGTSPLVVTTVQPNSPAGKAGLLSGDAILQVNGKTPRSFIDFSDLLAANPGSEAKLSIQRGSAHKEISVRLVPEKSIFNAQLIRDRLGLNLEELTRQTASRFGVGTSDGFIVTGVQEGSPAAAAGLQSGILVTALDGQLPPDLTGAAKLIYAKKKGDPLQLEFVVSKRRGGFTMLQQAAVQLVPR